MSQNAMIIDDNALNRKVLSQLLHKEGIDCIEVPDPCQLTNDMPTLGIVDMVFLDLEMPDINGYEVKDILRQYLGNTPIIAYTVHVSEINVVKQAGFDGFIGKPLDRNRFPDLVARILNGLPVWERA